jgi:hypothetical protein
MMPDFSQIQLADAKATSSALPAKSVEEASLLTAHGEMFLPMKQMCTEALVQLPRNLFFALIRDGKNCFLLHLADREDGQPLGLAEVETGNCLHSPEMPN